VPAGVREGEEKEEEKEEEKRRRKSKSKRRRRKRRRKRRTEVREARATRSERSSAVPCRCSSPCLPLLHAPPVTHSPTLSPTDPVPPSPTLSPTDPGRMLSEACGTPRVIARACSACSACC